MDGRSDVSASMLVLVSEKAPLAVDVLRDYSYVFSGGSKTFLHAPISRMTGRGRRKSFIPTSTS